MKTCTQCKQSKDLEDFPRSKAERTGYKPSCKTCKKLEKANWYKQNIGLAKAQTSAYQKKNRKARTAYVKLWRFTNIYGIAQEQHDQLFLQQEGKCAICSKRRDELDRDLCVDHDHKTDKVRGLLCYPCNVALGYMKDSVASLLSAVKYLETANASSVD